jgi:hypothetical protein
MRIRANLHIRRDHCLMRGQHGDRSMTKPMHVDVGGAKHDGRD